MTMFWCGVWLLELYSVRRSGVVFGQHSFILFPRVMSMGRQRWVASYCINRTDIFQKFGEKMHKKGLCAAQTSREFTGTLFLADELSEK